MNGCESSSAPRQQIRCCLTLDTKFDGELRNQSNKHSTESVRLGSEDVIVRVVHELEL
jgi:hypothetical protein